MQKTVVAREPRLFARQLAKVLAVACAMVVLSSCARKTSTTGPVPQRIVSISPSTTETLFAIGAGSRLVARSRFCDYPPEVARLPSVGGYIDPSLEAILALSPDLVVGARGPTGPWLVDKLAALGIATFFPPTESMAEIDSLIEHLGERVGASKEARTLVAQLRARRQRIARSVAAEPATRVLLVFGVAPIVVAGPDSFPNEMIGLANGDNVVKTGSGYPTIGLERLIALDPELVVNASMAGVPGEHGDGIAKDDPGWRELTAVREGRVVAIHDEAVLRPGPRIAEGLATLARALHPNVNVP